MRRLVLLALLLIAGCAAPPPAPPDPAVLSFGAAPPFALAVGRLVVVDGYRPPPGEAHVEHLFPIPPATAAADWAHDRLRAVGQSGTAPFTILEASAVAVPLPPQSSGLAAAFNRDPETRYDTRLAVRLAVDDPQTGRAATVTAEASRSQAINQGATPAERRHLWFTLTADLLQQLDAELARTIPRYLGGVLR